MYKVKGSKDVYTRFFDYKILFKHLFTLWSCRVSEDRTSKDTFKIYISVFVSTNIELRKKFSCFTKI